MDSSTPLPEYSYHESPLPGGARRLGQSPRGWQVIACDLDGTLLSREHRFNPQDIEALRRARAAGLHVALCTGRSSLESARVAEALDLSGPGVFVNGGTIAEMANGRTLSMRTVAPTLADEVVDFFGSRGHAVLVLVDDPKTRLPVYLQTQHGPVHKATTEWLIANRMHALVQDEIEAKYRQRIVRLGIVVNAEEAVKLERELTEQFGTRIFFYSIFAAVYGARVLEVFEQEVTKWSGLVEMCRLLGCGAERAVAIGDDVNDLPMLRGAALSFAMGNASDLVKGQAKRVTRTQAEGGVAEVIEGVLEGRW